ncbi:MAG: elongation factor G [Myxococcota bacterium]
MTTFSSQDIRNVALIGHKGTGKTSVGEAMLFTAKSTTRLGKVDEGNTVLDFEPEEHKRVASVQSSLAYLAWKKHKINILDTPGDPIFAPDANNCLAVSEGALLVAGAADEIEPQAIRLFKRAEGKARAVVINKMARERADFDAALAEVKAKLTATAVPVTLPIGVESAFKGVVDLIELKAHMYTPGEQKPPAVQDLTGDLKELAGAARATLMEEIAATDEALMEKFLDSGELNETDAREGLRRAIAAGTLTPVFAVDALLNIGFAEVLDLITTSFPSPERGAGIATEDAAGAATELVRKPNGDAVALVFKTIVDQHSGKISVFKILSGALTKDTNVTNVTRDAGERIGSLFTLVGKKTEPVEEAPMGDIAAVAKLKDTNTGDTLCAGKTRARAKLPVMPPPQISFRLIPKNKGDEDKISQAIHRLRDEDPTLLLGFDELTKEMVLSGYGVAHIDIAIEKMARKFGVQVDKAQPNVPYRETIAKTVKNVEGKHKKQSGGRGQFGVCYINMSPLARGEGYKFVDSIFGGSIPRQYIPAVDKGIHEALGRGVVSGYPVVDVQVEVFDGKYHDVDSSEMAFKIAGSKAFQTAAKAAGVVILEPVMTVEIEVPEESMGDVMGDINSRRGRVLGMESQGGVSTVRAQVPMAEMLTYAPDLKSMTAGRGWFTMHMSHYDPVPGHLMDKIIAASPNKPHADEED